MQATGHWGAILGATLVIAGALGGAPVAIGSADATSAASDDAADGEDGDNEAPLPDAGLDQEVPVNATVYLDASGSRDPDGSIESYEWSIERPDGNNIEPDCPDCARTEFRVATNGTYEATVTVTDDDGETSSDTLYIQAAAVEGPSVELAGPTDVGAGLNTTYTATADSGDSPLMKVEWSVNGSEVAESETSGESATDDFRTAFESGTYTLAVRVVSERGRTDTATLTVDADRPLRPCPGATWNTTLSAWNTDPCSGSQVDSGPDLGRLDTAGSETNRTACLTYNQDDEDYAPNDPEHYCENDRLFGTSNLSLTDADQDGEITWGGVTFTQARLERL
ncbi:MAG: PKD domain-containing protein, partial [Haloarculaceae archaeon]